MTVTNIALLANPDDSTLSIAENTTNTLSLLDNRCSPHTRRHLEHRLVAPTNGTATISGTNVIFTPTPDFLGTATIGYTLTDGIGGTNTPP